MASPYTVYPGGSIGADLTTRGPWQTSGQVWYVQSTIGVDAATPRGLDRIRPLATLAQAYTSASANDTVICLENHAESLGSAQTLAKAGLHIYGEGSGVTRPRFTSNAAIAMFDITADGNMLENLYFPASTTAAPTARVRSASLTTRIKDCYFECGTLDTASALKFVTGAGHARIDGTWFISTSTDITLQPAIGIEIANAMTGLDLMDTRFDGGVSGWSDKAIKGTAAVTRLFGLDVTMLNGSDLIMATGSSYRFYVTDDSGSVRLEFTA